MLSSILLLTLCAEPPPPQELTLKADLLLRDGQKKLTNADGHAHFTAEGAVVDAERMVYDENEGAVTAVGNVVARIAQGGLIAVLGDVVTLRLDGDQIREIYMLDGHAINKKDATGAQLLAADTKEKLEAVGHTQALLDGNHLVRDGTKWHSDRITLVPCECDFTKPSWSIEATGATLDTEGKRVAVVMPVVKIRNVPVLWFPWLSLPLENRQTGLLFTKPGWSPLNGFTLEQPVFITLGRSADVTLTPGYFFGAPNDSSGHQQGSGLAGPRLNTEFRYAPSPGAIGRISLGLVYDTKHVRDPLTGANCTGADISTCDPRVRGLRGELSWTHVQDLDFGFGLRADLNAYSDGFYNRDVTTDVVANTNGALRSALSVFQRGADHLLTVDVGLRQDLLSGYDWLGGAPTIHGPNSVHTSTAVGSTSSTAKFGPGTLQRWPALTASVPYKPLAGPLAFDFTGEFVRLSPLFSKTGDEGISPFNANPFESGRELDFNCANQWLTGTAGSPGSYGVIKQVGPECPVNAKQGQGDRIWQPGEREARDRFMLFPRLHVAGSVLGVVGLSAWAGWRQSVWLGEASGHSWQRGTLVVDARAETELSRASGGFRHTLQPLVAVRAVPLIARGSSDPSSLEPVSYDEVDAAVPRGGGGRAQLALELRQRLTAPGGLSFRLDLGQGVDLAAPERSGASLGESYGKLAAVVRWFKAEVQARVDPILGRLTRMTASSELNDGRGHGLRASYDNALDDGTSRSRAPIDLLFGTPVPAAFTSRAQMLGASAFYNFGWMGLSYDIGFSNAAWAPVPSIPVVTDPPTPLTLGAPDPMVRTFSFSQHRLTLSLTPACDCWRVDLYAMQHLVPNAAPLPINLVPELGATITVSNFGSIGTR